MDKKFIILGGVILLLIASTSLAAFLDIYVKMQGTAETSAPEFYIGSAVEETLLINEKPSSCVSFSLQNLYRVFKTEDLGGVNFDYLPQVKFFVRAGVATTTPQDLILSFGYFDVSDIGENLPQYLHFETILIDDQLSDYDTTFQLCSKKPTNVKRFFYEFKKGCLDYNYTISKCTSGFYTKVELKK